MGFVEFGQFRNPDRPGNISPTGISNRRKLCELQQSRSRSLFFDMHQLNSPIGYSTQQNILPTLPAELWEIVFYWATFSEIRDNCSSPVIDIRPFAAGYGSTPYDQSKEVLSTKHSLSLVCTMWRALSLRYLFEDIWIRIRGAHALEMVLRRESNEGGQELSSFVRCARV